MYLYVGFVVAGMPICEAFAQIEQQPKIYDVVHVKYFDEVLIDELNVRYFRYLLAYEIRH